MLISSFKGYEMMFESFPQFIFSLFMMQALQIREPLNILSCSASGLSVFYGTGDYLAMMASENRADYPFSRTIWGTLSTFIDTMFRSFTIAYWMTISKAYVIIVPFIYCIIMLLLTFMKAKKQNGENFEISVYVATFSFGTSSYERNIDDFKHFTLRPLSKAIFGAIFIIFSIHYGISISPKIFVNTNMNTNYTNVKPSPLFHNNTNDDMNFQPSNCSIFCQGNRTNEEQEAFENYCNNLWENLDPDIHQSILTVIGIFFLLSILEGVLEFYFNWMPYNKLRADWDDPRFIRSDCKGKKNEQMELHDIPNPDSSNQDQEESKPHVQNFNP